MKYNTTMDKGKTTMDLYQQEVENLKPQTNDEVVKRYEYLLNVTDDHFLRGEVYSSNSIKDNQNNKPDSKE